MKQHKNQKVGGRGLGNGGNCICNHCGTEIAHQRRVKCTDTICPSCGKLVSRKESPISNPTSKIKSSIRIAKVIEDLCFGCSVCVDSCPFNAISMSNSKAVIDAELCRGCMKCAAVCPKNAIVRA